MKKIGEDGFTLLEALIVVTVISVMLAFSLINVKPVWKHLQLRLFLTQFQADIYMAHAHAVNREETVKISFRPNKYTAYATQTKEELFERDYPESISLPSSNMKDQSITPSGTVADFGTLTFSQDGQEFKIIFYIGRGRFRVQK